MMKVQLVPVANDIAERMAQGYIQNNILAPVMDMRCSTHNTDCTIIVRGQELEFLFCCDEFRSSVVELLNNLNEQS